MKDANKNNAATSKRSSSSSIAISDDSSSDDTNTVTSQCPSHTSQHCPILHEKANALVAKELNALSAHQRELLFDDIHGVTSTDNSEKTPKVVQRSLALMQTEVERMRTKTAYNRAQLFAPQYVQDQALRLATLRAAHFDATKAAKRLIRFFQLKMDLFGIDNIVSSITHEHLTEQQRHIAASGFFHISPNKDSSGRTVVLIMPQMLDGVATSDTSDDSVGDIDRKALIGACWYLFMAALRDPSMQSNGFVVVAYDVRRGSDGSRSAATTTDGDADAGQHSPSETATDCTLLQATLKFIECMPAKCHAIHCCHSDDQTDTSIAPLQLAISKDLRLRLRTHAGSHAECQAMLATYGISRAVLSVAADGTHDPTIHAHSINELRNNESDPHFMASAVPTPVHAQAVIPTTKDVILGRGRPFQDFRGNVFLSTIIDKYRNEYLSGNRQQKAELCQTIVRHICDSRGGRFLRRCSKKGSTALWEGVSDEVARKKVSHSFRAPPRQDLVRSEESGQYLHLSSGGSGGGSSISDSGGRGGGRHSVSESIACTALPSVSSATSLSPSSSSLSSPSPSSSGHKRALVTPTQPKRTVSIGGSDSDSATRNSTSNKRQCCQRIHKAAEWPVLCCDEPIAFLTDSAEAGSFLEGNLAILESGILGGCSVAGGACVDLTHADGLVMALHYRSSLYPTHKTSHRMVQLISIILVCLCAWVCLWCEWGAAKEGGVPGSRRSVMRDVVLVY